MLKKINDNNSDFNKVYLKEVQGVEYPHCKEHGAMIKVNNNGLYRCIRSEGSEDCRAGCDFIREKKISLSELATITKVLLDDYSKKQIIASIDFVEKHKELCKHTVKSERENEDY